MSEANGPMIQAGQARKQQWAVLTAGMMLGVALATTPAMAQGGDQPTQPTPPPQPGAPTGPAGQPNAGPTLTISQDGTTSTQPPQNPPQDEPPSAQTLKLPPKSSGGGGPAPLIWAGTVLFADQSINSEGVGVGKDYQSRNPSYQLWFSARPRIALYNGAKDKVNVNARLDLTKELTNADDTTEYRQNMLGDLWLNFVYSHTFVKRNGWVTSALTGPRFLFPTSPTSQAAGIITTVGMGGGLMQMIPLNKGEWFSSARLFGSVYYTHPFTKATTGESDLVNRPRATLNPNISSISNQLSGGLLVEHQLLSVLDSGVQITPKLGFTADLILIQQWRYRPSVDAFSTDTCKGIPITIQTGEACAVSGAKNEDPQRYRLSSYLLLSVDYQLSDELNLSLNYYNFTNTIGPDGKQQNIFYAPESSRFSFTATIGLDALYERFRGSDSGGGNGAQGSRVAKGQTTGVGSFLAGPHPQPLSGNTGEGGSASGEGGSASGEGGSGSGDSWGRPGRSWVGRYGSRRASRASRDISRFRRRNSRRPRASNTRRRRRSCSCWAGSSWMSPSSSRTMPSSWQ